MLILSWLQDVYIKSMLLKVLVETMRRKPAPYKHNKTSTQQNSCSLW